MWVESSSKSVFGFCLMYRQHKRLEDLRAAWPTGHRAGAGSTELGHSTGEQVDVLEERYRCSQ